MLIKRNFIFFLVILLSVVLVVVTNRDKVVTTKIIVPEKQSIELVSTVSVPEGDWLDYAAEDFIGGSGTAEDPYLIGSAEELARLAKIVRGEEKDADGVPFSEKSYLLMNNVNLALHFWSPIGGYQKPNESDDIYASFRGHFDGGGHDITNMKMKGERGGSIGLFRCLTTLEGDSTPSAIVGVNLKDVHITGVDISGGALVAKVDSNSVVADSSASGSIQTETHFGVGGLVGLNLGRVSNSSSYINIYASLEYVQVGGLIDVNKGTVTNCRANGSVNVRADFAIVGGLISVNSGLVEKSSMDGSVSGSGNKDLFTATVGSLVGINKEGGMMRKCSANGRVKEADGVFGRGKRVGYFEKKGPSIYERILEFIFL